MVQVVMGNTSDFNALVYGQPHPEMHRFLRNQYENVSNTLNDAGKKFFAASSEMIDRFNGSQAMLLARAALRKVGSVFQRDEIRSIWEIGELQNAPLSMQRWIMAQPDLRTLYHQQRCDGYADTYIDMQPNATKESHYDYRRVMDGLVVDDEEYDFKCTLYFDDLIEGDRELHLLEQRDVLVTWEAVKAYLKLGGEDPSSPLNTLL